MLRWWSEKVDGWQNSISLLHFWCFCYNSATIGAILALRSYISLTKDFSQTNGWPCTQYKLTRHILYIVINITLFSCGFKCFPRFCGFLFLACNHVTRRPCWWCVGGQYDRIFSRRIYMKIGFSSQRKKMLLFWPPTNHQHGRGDVTCKVTLWVAPSKIFSDCHRM